ncbi:DUF6356 family protein [Caulobacter sp. S45]|uniref:DUF6356 family protein n=1 Tax=Caulobacter sp. S45 TaxID=1641861 RepID=UPI001576E070|nr:DUF6356 family protein [Caulobacter sp. S45]
MERLFLSHPRSVGETYFEHQRAALGVAAVLLGAFVACLVHAIVPHLFQATASEKINRLHLQLSERRRSALLDAGPRHGERIV